jgi:hypothetical protein
VQGRRVRIFELAFPDGYTPIIVRAATCLPFFSHPYSASIELAKAEGESYGLEDLVGVHYGKRRLGASLLGLCPGRLRSGGAPGSVGWALGEVCRRGNGGKGRLKCLSISPRPWTRRTSRRPGRCYTPLVANPPGPGVPLAASVQQRIAFGKRAGQQVRRRGSSCGHAGEAPTRTSPRGASLPGVPWQAHPHGPAHQREQGERLLRSTARGAVSLERLPAGATGALLATCTHPGSDGTPGRRLSPWARLEKRAALGPWPPVPLVRSGGCWAPHHPLRGSVIPTPRQPGVDEETAPGAPCWSWPRLLQPVFARARAHCPCCPRGALRRIAARTPGAVLRTLLRPLARAVAPLPWPQPVSARKPARGPRPARAGGGAAASPLPQARGGLQPGSGPPPAVPSPAAEGWGGLTVRRPAPPQDLSRLPASRTPSSGPRAARPHA